MTVTFEKPVLLKCILKNYTVIEEISYFKDLKNNGTNLRYRNQFRNKFLFTLNTS